MIKPPAQPHADGITSIAKKVLSSPGVNAVSDLHQSPDPQGCPHTHQTETFPLLPDILK